MMKFLENLIKHFKAIRRIYSSMGTFLVNILKLFITPDDKLILFNCFGGKKYDDSPKALYEQMLLDKRFDEFKIVWAFHEPAKFIIPRGEKVKTGSLEYYIIALKARCWITNSSVQRGLYFKGKNTIHFNTWHGTPIKKMGNDIGSAVKVYSTVDIMVAQGTFDVDIFSRVFEIPKERFLLSGLPRNDALLNNSEENKRNIKQKLGIPFSKKVILYAPTFRDFDRDTKLNTIITPPIDFEKWRNKIGEEYVLLFRSHYEVVQDLNFKENEGFLYNVSDYPVLNDLMLASDMLITDYSSLSFDYSILERPIICYTYDYDIYNQKRGMYIDIRKYFIGGSITEDELLYLIENLPLKLATQKVIEFKNQYVEKFGNATSICLDTIFERIK